MDSELYEKLIRRIKLLEFRTCCAINSGGGGGGAVDSVFGRTGVVVAANNDYTFAQLASIPTTLLGYGITDAQPLEPTLTALAGVVTSADKLIYATGVDTFTTADLSAFARTILDDAAATNVLTTLGVSTFVKTILDDVDAATVRATIGAGTGSGDALTASTLAQFAATTSLQLKTLISDETGSGALVFGTSPTLNTPIILVGSDATGDFWYNGGSGAVTRLAKGTANQILGMNNAATGPEYKTLSLGTTAQSNDLGWVLTGANAAVLHVPDASATVRGVMTTGTQAFAGAKTFVTGMKVETTGSGTNQGYQATSGEMPAGAYYGSSGSVGMSILSGVGTGTNGLKVVGAYYNGSAWKSAIEWSNTTGAVGTNVILAGTTGQVGVRQTTPTAYLHIGAGTATASTAPLKFTSGTNLTTVENGAVEYDGTNYFASSGSARYTLAKTLTSTAALDFPSTLTGTSSDLTITVTGAADGDAVALGVPNAAIVANTSYSAWVSATNTVTVRLSNHSAISADPASGTFRVSVLKY